MKSPWVLGSLAALCLARVSFGLGTNLPAELCVRVSGPSIYLNGGRIENNDSTQVLSVDCPILSHNYDGPVLDAVVYFRDLNPNDEVRCSIVVTQYTGASVVTQQTVRTSGVSFVSSEYKFLILSGDYSIAPDAYFINCRIPPKTANGRSAIAYVTLNEFVPN